MMQGGRESHFPAVLGDDVIIQENGISIYLQKERMLGKEKVAKGEKGSTKQEFSQDKSRKEKRGVSY